jgi:flagellar motor switch protein FliG
VSVALPRSGATLDKLSGAQKSAVLCMVLGKEQAAKVMQLLTPVEVEEISREIATLPRVQSEVVDAVLSEYRDVARAVDSYAQGGVEYAEEILTAAVGTQRARTILDRIRDALAPTGLNRLKKAAPDLLLGVLRGEHPQTLALILAHLDVRQAAAVIEVMEPDLASEVLFRVARMDKVSPDMVALVEQGLGSKADLSLSQEMTLSGGPQAVANVLNITPPSVEKALLASISERDGELAEQIKGLMFVFEDLKLLDGRAMQRVLRDIDSKELAVSLKVASEELKNHILKNMSERAAAALQEEIDFLGPVKVKDVEAAHMRIIQIVRGLEETGEITISGRGGDSDVVV